MLEQNKKSGCRPAKNWGSVFLDWIAGSMLGLLIGVVAAPVLALAVWVFLTFTFVYELTIVAEDLDEIVVERAAFNGWELTPALAARGAIAFEPEFTHRIQGDLELTVRRGDARMTVRERVRTPRQPAQFPLHFRLDARFECKFAAYVAGDRIHVSPCRYEYSLL
jgi:hypothetical protein